MRTLTSYRTNVLAVLQSLLGETGRLDLALDVGAGEGWFADQLERAQLVRKVVPVEVKLRSRSIRRPVLFDGSRLPFPDRSADLVYAIDVLHHCPDPRAAFAEFARCSKRFLILKDHTYRSAIGRWTLILLDELGNRRFGVPSPGKYQKEWSWMNWAEQEGFLLRRRIHPAKAQTGLLGRFTNPLQFAACFERRECA